MSAKPDAGEPAKAPPKSKKLLLIVGIAVVVLALIGGGGWFYLSRQHAAVEGEGEVEEVVRVAPPKGPPTFLPLDNMIVNLADPGGEKIAQIGVTLELSDLKATEKVRLYLPAIRSDILLLISQRTAEELLQREGKEKLAADILRGTSRHFVSEVANVPEKAKKETGKPPKASAEKNNSEESPVRGVLFSSFIVQ